MAEIPKKPRAGRPKGVKPGSRGTAAAVEAEEQPSDEETETSEPTAEGDEDFEPAAEELEEVDLEEAERARAVLARAPEAGIAAADPLTRYMREVGQHKLLTREEELALAKQYRATGDLNAAYRLVASNLRLVVKLAHEYHRNPIALLDLIQEGNIGLMQAVKKFDPERGVKLSSYSAWWIRAYILRYIMDNWKMVKLGTTEAQRKLFFKLRQEQARLSAEGFEATPKLIAERLNVTEQDVVDMDQRLSNNELTLDMPAGDEGKGTRGERLTQEHAEAADDRLANAQLKQLFREKMAEFALTLKDKEQYIFEQRLFADEPLTLQQIGDKYGVSRERARQIEAALIGRIRDYMRQHMPDFDLATPEE